MKNDKPFERKSGSWYMRHQPFLQCPLREKSPNQQQTLCLMPIVSPVSFLKAFRRFTDFINDSLFTFVVNERVFAGNVAETI
jgi:hypothetical protein